MAGPGVTAQDVRSRRKGTLLVLAGSIEEVGRIAASDPTHASGARSFAVRPWLLNEGTVTVKIRCSDASREVI